MKKNNLFSVALLLLGTIVLSGCEKGNNEENIHNDSGISEMYALDISEETDWDYVVAADNEEGSSVWFTTNKATNIPTTLFFKPFSNQNEGFVVQFKSNGLPDYAVLGDTIIVFENFRDTRCDIAVIYPNISVKYFNNIETGTNFNEIINLPLLRSSNSEISIAFEHGLKFVGSVLGVVAAVAGVSAAITVGTPVAIALAGVAAGITAVSLINNYWKENSGVGLSSTVGGKVMTMIGCTDIRNIYNKIECFSGLASFTASFASNMFSFANNKKPLIETVQANMAQNPDTPDNPDNPNNPNNPNNPINPNNPDNPNNPNNPVNPNTPNNIVNKTLSITLKGNKDSGTFSCILKPNGVAQISGIAGRWEQSGNSLRINWKLNNEWNCTYRLTGTLNGSSYSGTYTHYDGATLYSNGTFSGSMQ